MPNKGEGRSFTRKNKITKEILCASQKVPKLQYQSAGIGRGKDKTPWNRR